MQMQFWRCSYGQRSQKRGGRERAGRRKGGAQRVQIFFVVLDLPAVEPQGLRQGDETGCPLHGQRAEQDELHPAQQVPVVDGLEKVSEQEIRGDPLQRFVRRSSGNGPLRPGQQRPPVAAQDLQTGQRAPSSRKQPRAIRGDGRLRRGPRPAQDGKLLRRVRVQMLLRGGGQRQEPDKAGVQRLGAVRKERERGLPDGQQRREPRVGRLLRLVRPALGKGQRPVSGEQQTAGFRTGGAQADLPQGAVFLDEPWMAAADLAGSALPQRPMDGAQAVRVPEGAAAAVRQGEEILAVLRPQRGPQPLSQRAGQRPVALGGRGVKDDLPPLAAGMGTRPRQTAEPRIVVRNARAHKSPPVRSAHVCPSADMDILGTAGGGPPPGCQFTTSAARTQRRSALRAF